MNEEIKVSIIIPTYKRSQDITRAVDSCLSQTLDNIQIIVVDDNGKGTEEGEKTENAMKKYIHNPQVLYLQHDNNRNGSAARNTGIKASMGKYVSFLDDDDKYLPTRLEKMYNKMEKLDDSWGACYTGYVKHQANGIEQYSKEKKEGNLFAKALMRSFYIGSGTNMFFRRSAIDNIGLFDETFKRNQDLEYMVRVLSKYKIAYVDEILMEVFYDVRTSHITFEQSCDREILFRQKFSPFRKQLDSKTQREIEIMYDIDWMRACIGYKKYKELIKCIFRSKIPIYIYYKYFLYIIDRWKNNTCYGFDVKLG